MMPNKEGIYQRINAIRESNEYIKKEKLVDNKYLVVTHDQVTAAVRADLVKHGVVIEPYMVEGKTVQDTLMHTSKSVPIIRFEGVIDVFFVNVDNPTDRACVRVPVHALDTGDKAPGKAVSYAVKMAMLKMFSIETGEEDEDRKERESVGDSITVNQYNEFVDTIGMLPTGEKLDEHAQKLWEDIIKVCKKAQDKSSATKLRARLTAQVTKLRKGAGDAAPAKH